jgi:hypothetical protein
VQKGKFRVNQKVRVFVTEKFLAQANI